MAILNKELLQELGIQLDDGEYGLLSDHFDTTLHQRVIDEVVEQLSPEQAHELAGMQSAGDDELLAWLQTSVPEFSDIVSDEVDILLGELAENSEAINE